MNSFTGLSYDWKGANKDQMTLLWTMPQTRLPDDTRGIRNNTIEFDRESPDLQLFGGSYTFAKVFGGSLEVYGYGLYEQDTGTGPQSVQTRNRRLFTPGVRLARGKKPGELDYDFEAIYQKGLVRETTASPTPATSASRPTSSMGRRATPSLRPGCRGSRCNTITAAATAEILIPSPVSTPCSASVANATRSLSTGRCSGRT